MDKCQSHLEKCVYDLYSGFSWVFSGYTVTGLASYEVRSRIRKTIHAITQLFLLTHTKVRSTGLVSEYSKNRCLQRTPIKYKATIQIQYSKGEASCTSY